MDVIRKNDGGDKEELEFQFKLVDGIIDNSYAVVTARKMGIPQHVVTRADEVCLFFCLFDTGGLFGIKNKIFYINLL